MAKQNEQQNDDLFGNINMDDFQSDLMTVDVGTGDASTDDTVVIEDPPERKPVEDVEKDESKSQDNPDFDPDKDRIIVDDKTDSDIEKQTPEKEKETNQAAKEGDDKDDSKKGSASDRDENESPVYLHAAALQEEGVLPNFDLESLKDKDPAEAILEINKHIQSQLQDSIKEGVDEFKNGLGQRAKDFIDSLEKGIPFDDLAENYTLEERFSGIDEKALDQNEELQEAVYRDYLSMKGFSDARIERLISGAKDKDQLADESKDSLGEINQMIVQEREQIKQDAEKQKVNNEKKRTEITEKINSTVEAVKEILPGMELKEAEKKQLIKSMTVPVGYEKMPDGSKRPVSRVMSVRKQDPIAFEMRLNYFIEKGFFDKDLKNKDLQTFMKTSESTAAKRLAEKLKSEQSRNNRSTTGAEGKSNKKENEDFIFPQNVMV